MKSRQFWYRIFFVGTGLVLLFWFLYNFVGIRDTFTRLLDVSSPFLIGIGMAFVFNLPMSFLEEKLVRWSGRHQAWHRTATALSSVLLISAFLAFIIILVLPDLINTMDYFISAVPNLVNTVNDRINSFINNHDQLVRFVSEMEIDWQGFSNQVITTARRFIMDFAGSIINYVPTLINSIFDAVISFVFALYLLFTKENLVRQGKKIVYAILPIDWGNFFINVGSFSFHTFKNFFSGQIIAGLITGVALYIIMEVFNFPYSLSISVITGITTLIPFYGAILGGLLGCVLISVVDLGLAFWFLLVIIIVQQVEGNIIYPQVVGTSIGIPGIWVMVVVTIAGVLFGFAGMILSVPIFSIVYRLIADNINYMLTKKDLEITNQTSYVISRNIRVK